MNAASKIYITRAGRYGEDEDNALDNGLAIIGFEEVPSLAGMTEYSQVRDSVSVAMPAAKERAVENYARQLWAFLSTIKDGDLVILPRKLTSQIAIGRVKGPYAYQKIGSEYRHTRSVEWQRPDVPRSAFRQDLLYSFGAFMTVCNISRNNAAERVLAVLAGKPDPGPPDGTDAGRKDVQEPAEAGADAVLDLGQFAHDQVVAHVQEHFQRHALSALVDAVLQAEGWVTKMSPPGPDGGVDILAGRGMFGLDGPRLCVQVKSQVSPADVIVYRTLQGTMQTFNAQQGLLVCWGGFNKVAQREARQGHFAVRLWDSSDLVEAIYRNYEKLPAEIQAELPLKRVWMLVTDEADQ